MGNYNSLGSWQDLKKWKQWNWKGEAYSNFKVGGEAQGKDIGVSWIGLLGNNLEIPSMPSFSDKAGDKAFRVSFDFFFLSQEGMGNMEKYKLWGEFGEKKQFKGRITLLKRAKLGKKLHKRRMGISIPPNLSLPVILMSVSWPMAIFERRMSNCMHAVCTYVLG